MKLLRTTLAIILFLCAINAPAMDWINFPAPDSPAMTMGMKRAVIMIFDMDSGADVKDFEHRCVKHIQDEYYWFDLTKQDCLEWMEWRDELQRLYVKGMDLE